jgi:hypothetical protein
MLSLPEVARLLGGEVSGGQVCAPGPPPHSAADRSMTVKITDRGDDIVVFSHAGDDVLACRDYARGKLGLPDWRANGAKAQPGNIQYVYRLADGSPYLRVTRTPAKRFFQEHMWEGAWVKGGVKGLRIPYRLPELMQAEHSDVIVVEGEKDADNLAVLGFTATCNAGGAGKWPDELARWFKDRTVTIMGDRDRPGEQHVALVESKLRGVARSVRVVRVPVGKDVSDWIEAGATADDIAKLIDDAGKQAPSRLHFTAFRDITLSPAPRYLIHGVLPDTGLVVVWGPPKCGKSFSVFDMVGHVAAGWEYRGRRVIQKAVVYFALEGQRGFEGRVEAFRSAHHVTDIPFYLTGDPILLPTDGPAIVEAIRQAFPGSEPGIVVLDTLNRSIEGSENESKDMGAYVRAADVIRAAFGCVVIIIHHCGIDGSKPRGHTALTGAADTQLAVKRDDVKNVVTTVEYMKDGPEGAEIVSRLVPVVVGTNNLGEAEMSCFVEPAERSTSGKTKVPARARVAYEALCELVADSGTMPPRHPKIPPGTRTISENQWRSECYAKMFSDEATPDTKRKAFVRAAQALQAAKLLGKYGDHVWPVFKPDKPDKAGH